MEKRYGFCFRRIVDEEILGRKLRLIDGTIRRLADYDDAWSYALACHSRNAFDVGANIGQTAILILCSKTVEKIVLIEPNPKALSVAAENLFLNNLSANSTFIPAFASDIGGQSIDFWTIGYGAAGSMYKEAATSASTVDSSLKVPTITLDNLSEYYELNPDYVKIDVKGAESKVLRGAIKIASSKICKFLVEMHSTHEMSMNNNASKILDWCNKNKYKAYYLKEHSLLENPEKIEHRGRCHLLLLPEEFDFPIYLKNINQGDNPQF